MALSDDENATLAALLKKKDEPDEPQEKTGIGRVLNVTLDLGDDEQVKRAFKLGLLEEPAADEGEGEGDGEGEGEGGEGEGPRRRGFFD